LSTCEWCPDVHSWNRGSAPAALFSRESEALMAFGRALGTTFINMTDTLPSADYPRFAPTVARRQGCAIGCCLELRGQHIIYPDQVEFGLHTVRNALCHAGMLPGVPSIPKQINLVGATGIELCSPSDALMQPCVCPGHPVTTDDPIARLFRFDTGRSQYLLSPVDGAVNRSEAPGQMAIGESHDRAVNSAVRKDERIAIVYEW